VGFWAEYDTGTEPLHRLVAKIGPYERFRRQCGPDYPVLFFLPNPTREANLHRLLIADHGPLDLTVATTGPHVVSSHPATLAGPVWRIHGTAGERHRLIDLPSTPGSAGPYRPGPPTSEQDPLHLLEPVKAATAEAVGPVAPLLWTSESVADLEGIN
jgi:hypothetical protein